MRSFGWSLIQHDGCPYEKGKFGHSDRPVQREGDVKTGGMDLKSKDGHWSDALTSQGIIELASKSPEVRRGA